jgi:hypothetical protein
MTFKTPDLCDEFEAELGKTVRVVAPMFQRYGGRNSFSGQIVTLKIFEDNSLVRTAFAENGEGKVLVIDGGGSLRCAWSVTNWPFLLKRTVGKASLSMAASVTRVTSTPKHWRSRPEYSPAKKYQEKRRRPRHCRHLWWCHLQSWRMALHR